MLPRAAHFASPPGAEQSLAPAPSPGAYLRAQPHTFDQVHVAPGSKIADLEQVRVPKEHGACQMHEAPLLTAHKAAAHAAQVEWPPQPPFKLQAGGAPTVQQFKAFAPSVDCAVQECGPFACKCACSADLHFSARIIPTCGPQSLATCEKRERRSKGSIRSVRRAAILLAWRLSATGRSVRCWDCHRVSRFPHASN